MSLINTIGLIAAACTTAAFIPQVWQVWSSRSAKDISLGMYLIFILGVLLWLLYGIMLGDIPLIAANAVTLILAGAVLGMKLWFERK
ncbi:SemiSWEET transporter [Deefgea rivuli]|uniref:SemiSWEET transporter n=1 Tax=Deefgea rivuli TaxID=400948 RepID=UPI000483E8D1|nr:SemiSWEET transporter [Deefgea rivuli]